MKVFHPLQKPLNMPSVRSLALLGVAALGTVAVPTKRDNALAPPFLNTLMQTHGKLWLGTAADIPGPEQQDKEYMTILNDTLIFGEITPANSMKFEQTEPQPNVFNYTGGDEIINLAREHGKFVRCHNLVWESELPDWINNGNWTNATLTAAMQNHITNLIMHFGGNCYSWDVVNEALNSDGTFASNIWYQHIGAAYVPLAFQFAQAAVKNTRAPIKLYYNDYGIESPGAKQEAVVNMIQSFQSQGVQIDGIGLESHWEVYGTASKSSQMAAMQSYTNLGLEVAITELDVRFTNVTAQANSTGYANQATSYYESISACMDVPQCVGMTVWDFDDEYSWIPSTFAGQGAADLYNADFTRKPAYQAVAQAIQGKKCTVCA